MNSTNIMTTKEQAERAWNTCLKIIASKITPQSYKTWFSPIVPVDLKGKIFTIQVPSQFFYEWIEENYYILLKQSLQAVLGQETKLIYAVKVKSQEPKPKEIILSTEKKEQESPQQNLFRTPSPEHTSFFNTNIEKFETYLNKKYTFENLIKGSCNELAIAAAQSVSESPGKNAYNPLVIYGNVGLGKTHIMQAVANSAREKKKANFIIYVSSEKFAIEMVNAIKNNRIREFSEFYRNIDILIVDDIQFIAGKDKTQEEIFHIFNSLHQLNKQIILSCDRPIKDLHDIQDRLLSRFQWGLTADLQVPDYETRLAILYRKRDDIGASSTTIPDDVISFIARNVDTNIRELEGCVIRLLASASLHRKEISLETSKEILKDLIRKKTISVSTQAIEKATCSYFSISLNDLKGKSRRREIAHARHVCMFLMKSLTNASLKTIGLHLGGRDHSTVIHACHTIEHRIKSHTPIKQEIESIKSQLQFEKN